MYIKRVYEKPEKTDGYRVLVDRLWPRGLSKEKAIVNEWAKDIAPSSKLRQWYHHETAKWPDFVKRYTKELHGNPEAVKKMQQILANHSVVTLVYGAKDTNHNQAVVLKKFLEKFA